MKKRLIQTAFVLLFTVILCIFSMTAEPLSKEITDPVENTMSVRFTSAEHETKSGLPFLQRRCI